MESGDADIAVAVTKVEKTSVEAEGRWSPLGQCPSSAQTGQRCSELVPGLSQCPQRLGLSHQPAASSVLTLLFWPSCLLGHLGGQPAGPEAEPSSCTIRHDSAVSQKAHLNPGDELLVSEQQLSLVCSLPIPRLGRGSGLGSMLLLPSLDSSWRGWSLALQTLSRWLLSL